MASTADGVLLECVSTIIDKKLDSLTQLKEDEVLLALMSKLKKDFSPQDEFSTTSLLLQKSIKEHYLRDDLVDVDKAWNGDSLELAKLVLLLLYMSFIADKSVMTLLSSSLDHSLQLKLKRLFECVQRRGAGLSHQYLSVLVSESLDKLSSSGRCSWGRSCSPELYTSSPRAASRHSPLRELVQSPDFVVQRKLESRVKEIRRLNQQLTDLENEKQDWLVQRQISSKSQAKLGQEVQRLREQLAELRKERDDLETLVLTGEDQIHQQAQRLGRELSQARSENCSLQQTLRSAMDTNEQLSTKEETARSQLLELRKHQQTLQGELVQLQEQQLLTAAAMDERDLQLQEQTKRVQELERQLQESRVKSRIFNCTIESSLDASIASPPPLSEELNAASRPPPASPGAGDNMAAAVVDLLLQETRQQLQEAREEVAGVREEHSALQQQHSAALQEHERASKTMQSEQQTLKASLEQLRAELQQQSEAHCQVEQDLRNRLQQATSELAQLQERCQDLSAQLKKSCAAEAALQQHLAGTVARLHEERQQQVCALEERISTAEAAATGLRDEVTHLSSACSARELELTAAQTQATEAQRQLEQISANLRDKIAEMEALESAKRDLSDQVLEREGELRAVVAECRGKQQLLDKKETELQNIALNLENIKREGEKLFSESIAKVDSLSEDKLGLETKLSELHAQSATLTAALEEKTAHLLKLTASAEEMRAARDSGAEELRARQAETDALQGELRGLRTELSGLNGELLSAREDLCTSRARVQQLEKDKASAEEKFLSHEAEVKRLNSEKMSVEEQLRAKEVDASRLQGEVMDAGVELNRLEFEVATLRAELVQQQSCAQDAQQQAEQLREALSAVTAEKEALEVSTRRLVDEHKKEMAEKQQKLTDLECDHTSEVNTVREELKACKRQMNEEIQQAQAKFKEQLEECKQSLLTQHGLEVTQMITNHLAEKEELSSQLATVEAELHRLKSEMSDKKELLLQRSQEASQSSSSCTELQQQVKELKAELAQMVEKCELQARERDLISADLGDFKKTCRDLEDALKADKKSHLKALKEKDQQHENKVDEISQKLKEESKETVAAIESKLSEKCSMLAHLQSSHQALLEKHQSQEEANTIRVSELLSDIARLEHEKRDLEKIHEATLSSLNTNEEKSRSDTTALENRLQEMTLAREMLKIELSQSKKKHNEIEANLRMEVKSLQESAAKLQQECQDRTSDHKMASDALDEVRLSLASKERELQAALEAHAAKETSLAHEHNQETCSLEEKIAHQKKELGHLIEESQRMRESHAAEVAALRQHNTKTIADLEDSLRNEVKDILGKLKSLPECCELSELKDGGDSVPVLELMRALRDDLIALLQAKHELDDRAQKLLEDICCQKETTEKILVDKNEKIERLRLQANERASSGKEALDQMELSLKAKDDEITSLKECLLKKNLEINECKTSYEEKITQRDAVHQSRVEELQAEQLLEREKLTSLLAEKAEELEKSKLQLEKIVSDNSTTIFDLEAELQTLKTSSVALEADKRALERALSESSGAKADLGIKILELEEEVKVYKSRLQEKEEVMQSEREAREAAQQLAEELRANVAAAQTRVSEAEAKMNDGDTELELQDQLLQLQTRLQRAEAALVDKDKEVTAAKEDVMRVERESESVSRSLKEEMAALKLKYKGDKQAYADKMKSVFKDQIEKLMAEAEKYKSVADDYNLLHQKYEAAKNKLVKAYADLNDATKAKDEYYEQTRQLKDHVTELRESMKLEKQLRLQAESSVEPLKVELSQLQQSLKATATEKHSLQAKLSTADSKLRQMDRDWSRESLGGGGGAGAPEAASIRNAVSESTLPSAGAVTTRRAAVSAGRLPSTRGASGAASTVDTRSGAARRPAVASERRDPSAGRPAPATERIGSSALTASYRKAVGRSSTRAGGARTSSSTEEDTLDGSDIPLLAESRLDHQANKSKLPDGLFRKPSIRLTSCDKYSKLRAPVELRALTCKGDEGEDEAEGGADMPQAWQESEKKLREEKHRRAVEGERKKRMARNKDGRRMTVDGRILPDDDDSSALKSDGVLTRSVPRGLGSVFNCEDEDEEFFSNKYLQDMKVGLCVTSNEHESRLSELQRRNSLYPPHMRCSYAAEMQFNPLQDKLDSVHTDKESKEVQHTEKAAVETNLEDLESATQRLALESPAFNLRKRKSLSDSMVSADSLEISFGKKVRRLSTSYSRPGPPTPGRKSIGRGDKENRRMSLRSQHGNSPSGRSLSSCISSSSLPHAPSGRRTTRSPPLTILQPAPHRTTGTKRSSPATKSTGSDASPDAGPGLGGRGARGTPAVRRSHLPHTPASIKKLIKGKSPWKKLTDSNETPKPDSKLKIFRRPFGSKNYNVLSASQREREGADQSLPASDASAAAPSRTSAAASHPRRQNRTCV